MRIAYNALGVYDFVVYDADLNGHLGSLKVQKVSGESLVFKFDPSST